MDNLTDFLQALLRSPETDMVEVSVSGTVFSLHVGELATVVLAETDTRRTTVLAQPLDTVWEIHKKGADNVAFTMTSEEILHSMPYFQKTETQPDQITPTVNMVVNADGLNVRAVPYTTPYNKEIAVLARGTVVTVKKTADVWKQLVTPAEYKNAWVHGDYLSPKS